MLIAEYEATVVNMVNVLVVDPLQATKELQQLRSSLLRTTQQQSTQVTQLQQQLEAVEGLHKGAAAEAQQQAAAAQQQVAQVQQQLEEAGRRAAAAGLEAAAMKEALQQAQQQEAVQRRLVSGSGAPGGRAAGPSA